MLELCQRLHTSAPLRNMKKAREENKDNEAEWKGSTHACQSLSPHPYQVNVYSFAGDSLRDVLDQIPKANLDIALSGRLVVSHTIGNPPLLTTQTAYTQGSCQCSHSATRPDYKNIHDDTTSPLKRRLDEMDRIFGSFRSSVAVQSPSPRPTTPPPTSQPFVSNKSPQAPLDTTLSPKMYSWPLAPSIMSSVLPASIRAPPLPLASDLVYSQPKTKSLQEKLNTITQTMIYNNLGSIHTPSFSYLPFIHSGLP